MGRLRRPESLGGGRAVTGGLKSVNLVALTSLGVTSDARLRAPQRRQRRALNALYTWKLFSSRGLLSLFRRNAVDHLLGDGMNEQRPVGLSLRHLHPTRLAFAGLQHPDAPGAAQNSSFSVLVRPLQRQRPHALSRGGEPPRPRFVRTVKAVPSRPAVEI